MESVHDNMISVVKKFKQVYCSNATDVVSCRAERFSQLVFPRLCSSCDLALVTDIEVSSSVCQLR